MSLQSERPGVVFDLDGTLIDSLSEIHAAVVLTLEERTIEAVSIQEIALLVGQPPATFFAGRVEPSQVAEAVSRFRFHLEGIAGTQARIYDGTIDVLEFLVSRDIPMAVASNKSNRLAECVIDRMGLSKYFAVVQGTDGLKSKPAPDVVLKALGLLGRLDGYMIGDTLADVEAGRAAGLKTIGIGHGPGRGTGLERADFRVSDMPDLLLACRSGKLPV